MSNEQASTENDSVYTEGAKNMCTHFKKKTVLKL